MRRCAPAGQARTFVVSGEAPQLVAQPFQIVDEGADDLFVPPRSAGEFAGPDTAGTQVSENGAGAALPAYSATAAGYDTYVAVDASGTFSQTKRQAGPLKPSCRLPQERPVWFPVHGRRATDRRRGSWTRSSCTSWPSSNLRSEPT